MFVLGVVAALFCLVVFRGAPYVPTHRAGVRHALEMLDLPKGSTIVDLGSGDGAFLKAAAEQGYKVVGYELNPILCVISYLRCWHYRHLVTVQWRDFWLTKLPPETNAIFVFLAGPYLKQLDQKIKKERQRADKSLKVISYGFAIPGATPAQSAHALHLYQY